MSLVPLPSNTSLALQPTPSGDETKSAPVECQVEKQAFICRFCEQAFSNLRNLQQHHWCISNRDIEMRAAIYNVQDDEEKKEEFRRALVKEAMRRPPMPVFPDSPPVRILGPVYSRIPDSH